MHHSPSESWSGLHEGESGSNVKLLYWAIQLSEPRFKECLFPLPTTHSLSPSHFSPPIRRALSRSTAWTGNFSRVDVYGSEVARVEWTVDIITLLNRPGQECGYMWHTPATDEKKKIPWVLRELLSPQSSLLHITSPRVCSVNITLAQQPDLSPLQLQVWHLAWTSPAGWGLGWLSSNQCYQQLSWQIRRNSFSNVWH